MDSQAFIPVHTWNGSEVGDARWGGWLPSYLEEIELETGVDFQFQTTQSSQVMWDVVLTNPTYIADTYVDQSSDPNLVNSLE